MNLESIYDETILPNLPLRAMAQGLDHAPSKLEMLEAIGKLHDSAPGASGLRASAWKALAGYDSSADAIYGFISNFWNSEQLPESWAIGLLSILPKKGDLSLPDNYRGITMLEVAYKIIAQILLARDVAPHRHRPDAQTRSCAGAHACAGSWRPAHTSDQRIQRTS